MVNTTGPGHYEPIESASIDELRDLQLKRLGDTLSHAYANVAHYRQAFDSAGVAPADLQDLDDLARFPFLTKSDLRDTYPFGLFAVPRSEVIRIHASSGTTGKPTVVGYTAGDIDVWSRLMARSIYAAGGRPGDIAHVAYGYGLFTGGLGAHYGAETLGCMVVPVSGGQTERQVTLIQDFGPRIILVTPSYCLNLIDEMESRGMDPKSCSLEVGIFGAEPWTDELRTEIEQRLGIDAVDIYGLSEVMGPGVAQECVETKDGPTVWEDHFYPEIVDPGTGEALPDGQFGELVLTALTKRGQPTGRSDDMLIVRGVNVFPSQIEAEVLKVDGLSPHFQIEVDQSGNLAQLTVRVERSPSGRRQSDDLARDLAGHIKGNIGVTAEVAVVEPGAVPRSAGKAQRVVASR